MHIAVGWYLSPPWREGEVGNILAWQRRLWKILLLLVRLKNDKICICLVAINFPFVYFYDWLVFLYLICRPTSYSYVRTAVCTYLILNCTLLPSKWFGNMRLAEPILFWSVQSLIYTLKSITGAYCPAG